MAKHDFGIIDQFEENKCYYTYEPQKYNCTSINMQLMDLIIDNYLEEWGKIKVYLGQSTRPFYGIDENGIIIFPPESLKSFRYIVNDLNSKIKSIELINLIYKIDEAMQDHKHLIYFGI